jgi:hypothetical protein
MSEMESVVSFRHAARFPSSLINRPSSAGSSIALMFRVSRGRGTAPDRAEPTQPAILKVL